jgi:hypothetical protein
MTALTGGCLCGAIRYTVSVPITELRMCHCRDCQKSTGTGGSVNATIKSADMKISAHIWTDSARSWSHIESGAQQFPAQPDAPTKR